MSKRRRPPDHPDLFDGAPFGEKPEREGYEPPPRKLPPRWKRALAWLRWLTWKAWTCKLVGLGWVAWACVLFVLRKVGEAMATMLANWLALLAWLVIGIVVLAFVGLGVPASYWPPWLRRIPVVNKLISPPDLPPWRMEIREGE